MGVIYPGGAGYSDVHVLPGYDGPSDRLEVVFQRCLMTRAGKGAATTWPGLR